MKWQIRLMNYGRRESNMSLKTEMNITVGETRLWLLEFRPKSETD